VCSRHSWFSQCGFHLELGDADMPGAAIRAFTAFATSGLFRIFARRFQRLREPAGSACLRGDLWSSRSCLTDRRMNDGPPQS